jgi:hypothetical protein
MRFFVGVLSAFILVFASVLALSGCQQQRDAQPTQGHIEATSGQYRVSVHIPHPPLKTRQETYILSVDDIGTSQPLDTDTLSAKVTMTMPDHVMEAPTTVKKSSKPGQYDITTEFTMSGDWLLEVKPTPSAKTIPLKLSVDANE